MTMHTLIARVPPWALRLALMALSALILFDCDPYPDSPSTGH